MQAPKQELFILNWEVANLTKKLQSFANVYSSIDLKTVDLLGRLIGTLNTFLTNKSLVPVSEWDAEDDAIFNGYVFARSINCNRCDRSIRITKPSLIKHLAEHKPVQESDDGSKPQEVLFCALRGSTDDLVKPMGQLHIQDPPKNITIGTDKTTKHNTQSTSSEKSDLSQRNNKLPKAAIPKGQQPPTTAVNKPDESKKPTEQPESMTNGNDMTTKNSQQSRSKRKETATLKCQKPLNVTAKKQDKSKTDFKDPKRKVHIPLRTADNKYLEMGCLPEFKNDMSKKIKNFVTKLGPLKYLEKRVEQRTELTNSPAHKNIVKNLEETLKPYYARVKAYPFGSRVTGLGNTMSDLDVYIDLDDNYNGQICSREKLQLFVRKVSSRLNGSNHWRDLDPVTAARTPILRAWNVPEKIDCDISFSNGLSHRNTMLIQYLFDLQPVCYYVALYVKDWSKYLNINGLNTYTLIMLTIYFFQQHNLLPSVYKLQNDSQESLHINHWQAHFEKKSLEELGIPLIETSAVETYLVGFFSFYGIRFKFETNVVCPYLGWSPLKKDFDPNAYEIPVEMEHLQDYYKELDMNKAHKVNDLLQYAKPMVVQDPFELIHNVAKGLIPMDVSKFKNHCSQTAALLDEQFTHINK